MAPDGIPFPTKSKGVFVPVVEEEYLNVYKDGEDPEINVFFKESDLFQGGSGLYRKGVGRHKEFSHD